MDFSSIMGMLGSMGGGSGGLGAMLSSAGGSTGASLMKGLGAAADYYNNAGKPQQQQGMSLQDALVKQKQFKDNQTMQKMAAYQPMDTSAPDLSGITSMRY